MAISINKNYGPIFEINGSAFIQNGNLVSEEKNKETTETIVVPAEQGEPDTNENTSAIQPKRKAGRPRVENMPFEHFVKNKSEANNVLESLRQRISQTDGTAPKLGAVMGGMVGNQLAKVIPYKVLKREFGELVACAESDYNKQVTNLR